MIKEYPRYVSIYLPWYCVPMKMHRFFELDLAPLWWHFYHSFNELEMYNRLEIIGRNRYF